MDIKDFQKKSEKLINDIDKKLGVIHNDELIILHLTEELGELSRQIINPKLKRGETDIKNLEEEIADVIIQISKLASNHNINIEDAIKTKIAKLKEKHKLD